MILSLIAAASSLNITLEDSEIMMRGTPTAMTLNWDSNKLGTFIMLFSANGIETPVASKAGIAVIGNVYYTVSVTGTGSDTPKPISGTSSTTITTPGQVVISPLATSFTQFAILPNRIYPVCIYVGAEVNKSLTTAVSSGCGTYHTLTAESTFTQSSAVIDRNLGNYQSSKILTTVATDVSRTANQYNVTLYGSRVGNRIVGKLNGALVAYSTGVVTTFNMWSAVSIGTYSSSTAKTDFIGNVLTGASADLFSTTGPVTAIKYDNDTSLGCTNDVSLVSFGKSTTAGALYIYSHFYRNLVTTDISCDSSIVLGTTSLCALYKEGTATLTTSYGAVQDDYFCVLLNFAQVLSAAAVVLFLH